ncbi:MAG: cell division protein FtsZ [Anaerolineae bacterium]|nr:cell division protein FtsZ [Anaerolineae bacterium]
MDNTYEPIAEEPLSAPSIKVLGLGGGGGNAINRMIEAGVRGVEYIVANTDRQALHASLAPVTIQLGPKLTRGMGAGGDPKIGHRAADESRAELAAVLDGADMVFLTAGMGGGTGTGAIPVAAEIARSIGAVSIGITTTPFTFEGSQRQKNAAEGITLLRPHTDTMIAIPNDRLLYVAEKNLPLDVAFRLADDVLRQAVQGIAELVTVPGMINVDFAHVRRIMKLGGGALMAIGQGHGENKAMAAIEQALHHPLLESISLEDAAGLIVHFTGGDDLTLHEVGDALEELHKWTGGDVDLVMGVTQNEQMAGRPQAILVITGIGAGTLEDAMQQPKQTARMTPTETVEELESEVQTAFSDETEPVMASAMNDLDLPAFLRRRNRVRETN